MKLLLTSAGVTNDSIRQALSKLLGKPFSEARALCVPTAVYALPGGPTYGWRTLKDFDLGWQEFGVLELTALPSLPEDAWLPVLKAADLLIVGGGNTGYLSYWLHTSGLADKLPSWLEEKVYLGVSAGSQVVTYSLNVERNRPEQSGLYYDNEYDEAAPRGAGSDKALGLTDFVIRPHLGSEYFPTATLENMEAWAAKVEVPLYAIDNATALKVVDGEVEIVSEGAWQVFNSDRAGEGVVPRA